MFERGYVFTFTFRTWNALSFLLWCSHVAVSITMYIHCTLLQDSNLQSREHGKAAEQGLALHYLHVHEICLDSNISCLPIPGSTRCSAKSVKLHVGSHSCEHSETESPHHCGWVCIM